MLEGIDDPYVEFDIFDGLSYLHEEQGNFKEALKYYKLSSKTNNSILDKEKQKELPTLESRFETKKKSREISELKLQHKITGQQNYFLIALTLVLILIILKMVLH